MSMEQEVRSAVRQRRLLLAADSTTALVARGGPREDVRRGGMDAAPTREVLAIVDDIERLTSALARTREAT
jgi:hypothetical protein